MCAFYAESRRWPEALEAFARSISLNPGAPAAQLGLRACWQALGDAAKEEDSRQRALALDPDLAANT